MPPDFDVNANFAETSRSPLLGFLLKLAFMVCMFALFCIVSYTSLLGMIMYTCLILKLRASVVLLLPGGVHATGTSRLPPARG